MYQSDARAPRPRPAPSARWGKPGVVTAAKPRRGCSTKGGSPARGFDLLNGPVEAFIHSPRAGDASVMLHEDMGSSGNHFPSSLVTSTFAAARSAVAQGDDFTAFIRLHTI